MIWLIICCPFSILLPKELYDNGQETRRNLSAYFSPVVNTVYVKNKIFQPFSS